MSEKMQRIVWITLMAIPLLLVTMSALMKITGAESMVKELTKAGYGNYITYLGIIELSSVLLFVYPRTYKVGFLLLCGYLGGAMATELAGGMPPVAAALLTMLWISVFLRNRQMFLNKVYKK